MGTLFIVATPIGNLEDITLRAVRVLSETQIILCEDTRRAGLLFNTLENRFPHLFPNEHALTMGKRFISYYDDIELDRIPEVISLLKDGHSIALISDAGTPLISDPGFKLVRECLKEGIRVESIPGASSVTSALVSSGLPTDKFFFLGYPPRKPGNRTNMFESLKSSLEFIDTTVIFFEAPHRLHKTLSDLFTTFGDIEVVLCKELTKVHEKVRREKLAVLVEHFKKHEAKGEYVILFHIEKDA